jgi:hypothetical protein
MSKLNFEDCIKDIDAEIFKRKNKWTLDAIAWMDFSDVSQLLRIHIHKKWDQYDPSKPLGPWINRIVTNQIKNLVRNLYGNYSRPCLRCAAAEGDDLCNIYNKQCNDCPLYAAWEKSKKSAHDTKLPVSLEDHSQKVFNIMTDSLDIEMAAKSLHGKMSKILKPVEWKVYKHLYVDNGSEDDLARIMGYITSEKNRSPGYKQIKNIKKAIIIKVRKCISEGEIDI